MPNTPNNKNQRRGPSQAELLQAERVAERLPEQLAQLLVYLVADSLTSSLKDINEAAEEVAELLSDLLPVRFPPLLLHLLPTSSNKGKVFSWSYETEDQLKSLLEGMVGEDELEAQMEHQPHEWDLADTLREALCEAERLANQSK